MSEDWADLSGQMYAALAHAFSKPELAPAEEEDSLAQTLCRLAAAIDAPALGPIAERLLGSLQIAHAQSEQAFGTLEMEYNRLFVGPGAPVAPPYESFYRDPRGLLMGSSVRAVRQKYAEADLGIPPDHRDLPDHVATELGFMAYLALQEAAAEGVERQTWLDRRFAFLRQHLGIWLPVFCRRVQEEGQHPFYTALAELTDVFVKRDAQRLETALHERRENVST